eukprot:c39274_g1_i1.p1 GENE.c39274_g1_i1~~c39274_g1_i1.p1  ORF type:complete len:312 (+),score=49.24 c39274_g1_i1:29-964(+)
MLAIVLWLCVAVLSSASHLTQTTADTASQAPPPIGVADIPVPPTALQEEKAQNSGPPVIPARADISVCIPCIPRDVGVLPRLLDSIKRQTAAPKEVIISLSETSDSRARQLSENLNTIMPVMVINTESPSFAGQNRNRAAAFATAEYVTFIDADDEMHPQRLELIATFLKESGARCMVHGFSVMTNLSEHYSLSNARVVRGSEIYQGILKVENTSTIDIKPRGLHIKNKLNSFAAHHGHPSCQAQVFKDVSFPDVPRGQDSMFLRTILLRFGDHDDTLEFLDLPLSIYHPSEHEDNKSFIATALKPSTKKK